MPLADGRRGDRRRPFPHLKAAAWTAYSLNYRGALGPRHMAMKEQEREQEQETGAENRGGKTGAVKFVGWLGGRVSLP